MTALRELMGHNSLATTARYLHVTSQYLQGVHSPLELLRLPQAGDWSGDDVATRDTVNQRR